MNVAEVVGATLARLGADHVFGVVGSGNFHVTNALVEHGVRFVATRHEAGAATAADAYARISGKVGLVSVHQGCGLTNAMTGITEAAKSRTPMIVLAAEPAATALRSNFRVDQEALAHAVGAASDRVHRPETAVADVTRAWRLAVGERRTVLLNLPLDVQAADAAGALDATPPAPQDAGPARPQDAGPAGPLAVAAAGPQDAATAGPQDAATAGPLAVAAAEPRNAAPGVPPDLLLPTQPRAADEAVAHLAGLLEGARRPVFIAGRGARHAREVLEALADRCGALLATTAVAKGLFAGNPWNLDVSGGFATPLAAELITDADLVVAWGASLSMWTTRHGRLLGPDATVVQVDLETAAFGPHLGILGEVAATASAVHHALRGETSGYREAGVRARIAAEGRWRDVAYADETDDDFIDARTLSIALDDMVPAERVVAVDSGNFMGYPSMFLSVPDERGFCFTQAFQSVGLGLATAIGAALATPDRLPVAACGDGGFLMGIAELDTVGRLDLGMLIVIYNDDAYGAEVYHFGPGGHPLGTVTFPDTDLAAIARGHGCAAVTVRGPADLAPVRDWLAGPRDVPMVVDAKVSAVRPSWWLEDAFRGH